MFTKIFGPSRLQEEFQKSINLKLRLIVSSIKEIEFSIRQTQLKKKNSLTNILIDFENEVLIIQGDLFEELFNETFFQIVKINNLAEPLEIFLSNNVASEIIVMKCIVYRNYILFQGTLDNWHCKISNNIQISH